ncbi:hypothetical protein GR157_32195 [Burkholderia sp. 4701]|nr:hypothetical protein [Burkholderia sp. 4701]MXN86581.1 hypothetical protein [Burkholderia sp. 4812]
MKAVRVVVDKDFEDDGLYCVTLWVDSDPPRYVSVSRDDLEEPDVIYVEAQDQIYGKKTTDLTYSVRGNVLNFSFDQDSEGCFHWDNGKEVSIEIDPQDLIKMQATLVKIFSIEGEAGS